MPITMNDYLHGIADEFTAGLFENAYRMSNILPLFPVTDIAAPVVSSEREGALPEAEFRDLGDDFTDTTAPFGTPYDDKLAILGQKFNEDIAFQDWTKAKQTVNQVDRQYKRRMKAIERTWCDYVFNGDVNTNRKAFNGLYQRISSGEFPASQHVRGAGTGAAASLKVFASAGDAQAFFEKLDEASYQAGVWGAAETDRAKGCIFTNRQGILGFQKAAKMTNYSLYTIDLFEKKWLTYNGWPLVDVGYKYNATTEILLADGYADDAGNGASASRLFIVRFSRPNGQVQSEGSDGLFVATAGQVKRLKPTAVSTTQVEHAIQWQVGLAHPGDDYCVALLDNFKWAAS